jgi:hypothetical protein
MGKSRAAFHLGIGSVNGQAADAKNRWHHRMDAVQAALFVGALIG